MQTQLRENAFDGNVFVFRGRCGDRIKLLWWDGQGLCLFAKRLEQAVRSAAGEHRNGEPDDAHAMLLEGIDWRWPVRSWQPTMAV